MSDSTADTNIPVTRLPFGAELPPKVPYSTTDSVGVGDAASENLPVQVNNRQIVAVGTASNPIRAVHLKRKSSGKTVNDVPTSDTPNADDPDTMIATKQYVESNAGGFINGSYYIRFAAKRVNIKDDTPYKVYFESSDTVDGLQTESGTGKKFKWLCRKKSGSSLSWITSPTDDTSVGYLQQFSVSGWNATNRFANNTKVTTNVNAFIYKVQHDCLLHISLEEGTSESSDYGQVCVYSGTAWIPIANFKEFSSNTDLNSSIAFPCKAGTLIRCLYAAGRYQSIACTDNNGSTENSRYRIHWCSANGNDQGNIGMNAVFTEFKLFSKVDSSAPDGGEDSGGEGDDSGGGGDSGGTTVSDPIQLVNIASPQAAGSWSNITVKTNADTGEIISGATPSGVTERNYTCVRTNATVSGVACYTYTFTIPAVGISQIGMDFCCDNIKHSKMTMKVNGNTVALSQNYPNNVSGFQMFIPAAPFASSDNITIAIELAQTIEHANVWIYRK